MKPENFIHLIAVGETEAKMIQGLLQKEGIPSVLYPTSQADVLAGSAVHGNLPYEVHVPSKLLEKAKKLLNLEKPISISKEKYSYPRWVTLVTWIFILILIISGVIALLLFFL